MAKFNEILGRIEKRAGMYLEFKIRTGLFVSNNRQKFWMGRKLVSVGTWGEMQGVIHLSTLLKHMPDKFVPNALPPLFSLFEMHRADYTEWFNDYLHYLADVCGEPSDGLWERITNI